MRLLTGAAIALLASTAALAQPGPMGPRGGGPMMADNMPMMGMMGHCAMMRRSEGALAFLKTELKIAGPQEKAWNGFADAYRAEAAKLPKGPGGAPMGPGMMGGGPGMMGPGGGMVSPVGQPFPKAVETHLQMMERHIASARKLSDAAKPLYDALNAEQRKTADELLVHFVMMHCPMM